MKKTIITLSIFLSVLTGFAQQTIELKNWKFATGDSITVRARPSYNDSWWQSIEVGKSWESQGITGYDPLCSGIIGSEADWKAHGNKGYDGIAWYRARFYLPSDMKNQALFKDSICIYLGKIDDIDRTFLNGNILGENGKVVAANSGFIWDPMYGPKAPNVVRNYTLSANDPRLKWDRENVLAVRVVDVGGEGGMLSADLNVSMKGLANYLIIDKGTDEPQSLPGGLLSHTIVLKNQSPLAEISGILQINVENSDTKQDVFSQSFNLKLKHGKPLLLFSLKAICRNG